MLAGKSLHSLPPSRLTPTRYFPEGQVPFIPLSILASWFHSAAVVVELVVLSAGRGMGEWVVVVA